MKRILMMVALLLVYVQGARASLKGCEGTVYLKLPDGWTSAFVAGGGNFEAFNESSKYSGWYEISTNRIGGTNAPSEFHISKARNDYGQAGGITKTTIGSNLQFTSGNAFSCKDFGTTGELWIQPALDDPTRPSIGDKPPVVKYLFVLVPEDDTWKMAEPVIGDRVVGSRMSVDQEHCGWFYIRYVDDIPSSEVIIYRDYDEERNDVISVGRLDSIFAALEADSVYFVAESGAWSATYPGIAGDCGFNLMSIIYDSDASLHPSFSCYSGPGDGPTNDGCQKVNQTNAAAGANPSVALTAIYDCIGVTPGLVESTLDRATKKPMLTVAGKKCFIDDKYFNMLFNYTAGVNEVTCFDMPFTRASDGKWEFDSDFYTSPGLETPVQGGFYPAEATTLAKLKDADFTQVEAPLARTKRTAEGPVFYGPALRELHTTEKIPLIDTYCNGPGWSEGFKCDGFFADGDATGAAISSNLKLGVRDCVFGWSCPDKTPGGWTFFVDGTETSAASGSPRWKSEEGGKGNAGRNQHFCFESHAEFRFKKGLKFSIRGSDDIWVYIDNKIAVDLGGTHLSAPGYVDLDKFMPNAVLDSTYDIDIFICDRRTDMSDVRISTNMYIVQPDLGVSVAEGSKDDSGYVSLDVCHVTGGCGAVALGKAKQCGEDISGDVSYSIVDELKGAVANCEDCAALPTGGIVHGGIDLTNPKAPKILPDSIVGLRPGNYSIAITVGNDVGYYNFRVDGDTSVTPVLKFAQPEMDSLGNIVSWTELRADPDTTEEGAEYFHWVGDTLEMYLVVMYPQTDSLCKDCDYQLDFLDKSEGISGSVTALENGVAKVVLHSDSEYVKTSASITVGFDTLVSASYGNMHFHVAKTDEPEDDPKDEPKEEPKEDPKEDPEDEPKDEPKDEPAKDSVDTRANFSIRMVGPFQFAIVMDDENVNVHKAFAVMDVQGHVLYQGTLASREVVVPTLNAGSYIVKVGIGFRRVNVR